MNRTLVVGAAPAPGHEPFYRQLLADSPHVVAADAAGEWCVALGRVPDLVVGDFDGSAAGAVERLRALGCVVETHPAAKDRTDLELAVDRAVASWDSPIALTASFTSRIDHTLAAFGTLMRAGAGATANEPSWTAYVCQDSHAVALDLDAGVTVSVLALGTECAVTIEGARWPLHSAPLPPLSGLGISNSASGGPFRVSVTNGFAAVIVEEVESGGLY